MKNMLLLLVFFLTTTAAAQQDTLAKYSTVVLLDKSDFDVSNSKIYVEEALRRNPSDALKVRALLIMSQYHISMGDYTAAVNICKKSMALAKKINYTEYYLEGLSQLCGYYMMLNKNEDVFPLLEEQRRYNFKNYELYSYEPTTYALMGDFKKSKSLNKKRIEIAINAANEANITKKDYDDAIMTLKYTYMAMANISNYQKQLDSALYYLDKAAKIKSNVDVNFDWYIKAFNLILRNDYDAALTYMDERYEKYIKNLKSEKYQYFYYKAFCYQQKGDYPKGLFFAKQAIENKMPLLSFQNYELECYSVAADCAEKLGKADEVANYHKKYIEISDQVNYAQKAAFMAKLYEQQEIDPLHKELAATTGNAKMLFWGLGITGIAAGYLAFAAVRSRREKKKFLAIIERLENKNVLEAVPETLPEPVTSNDATTKENGVQINISRETESSILKKLREFEKNQRFLEANVSLNSLALDFDTNSTYITYIIKKYKNDNLANYINKLRIEYIIQKMASQPEYAKYKIEYLAQECGFSSYISFKRIFNKETGMDPSKFVNYLKDKAQSA